MGELVYSYKKVARHSPACALRADANIRVGIGWRPALCIGLTVDHLQVASALSVTIPLGCYWAHVACANEKRLTRSVFGPRRALSLLGHGYEVKCSVETAVECGKVHVESEFIPNEFEHLIVVRVFHQVRTRADVGAVATLGKVFKGERIAAGCDAVGTGVIGALYSAV